MYIKRRYTKRKKRKSYKDLRSHALRRLESRFELRISQQMYHEAVLAITRQSKVGHWDYIEFMKKTSNNRSLHFISIYSQGMVAVYDKKRGAIVTFLRFEWVSQECESEKRKKTQGGSVTEGNSEEIRSVKNYSIPLAITGQAPEQGIMG